MKVAELVGAELDYWVAMAEGKERIQIGWMPDYPDRVYADNFYYSPSADWSQGGPIIEREKIESYWHNHLGCWICRYNFSESQSYGETQLVSAMRCRVASKYGEEV